MREPLVFKKALGSSNLYYVQDKKLRLEDVIKNTKLSPLPLQASYTIHWLAIDGIQPDIPQNPAKVAKKLSEKDLSAKTESTILEEPEVKPAVRHVLSKELQEFYEKIIDSILNGESSAYNAALSALASDSGLHQLLPYISQFIIKQVALSLQNLPVLFSMMRMVHAILVNSNINIDLYIHQIIPVVLTCLVGKKLCQNPNENHWALRDYSADILSYICNRWGSYYATIQPRIIKTLLHAFLDLKKPLTTHYGAIIGLSSLGSQTRQLILLPNIVRYLKYLIPAIEQTENNIKRNEANMCYQALLSASGLYLFDSSKTYQNSEKILLESSMHLNPNKISHVDDNEIKSSFQSTLNQIKLEDMMPLTQNYSQLYQIFGPSIFPYVTRQHNNNLLSSINL